MTDVNIRHSLSEFIMDSDFQRPPTGAATAEATAGDWEIVSSNAAPRIETPNMRWQLNLQIRLFGWTYRHIRDSDYEAISDLSRALSDRERELAASASSMAQLPLSQDQSALFRLPAEIRLQIYELVLLVHSPPLGLAPVWAADGRPSVLSLLECCQRVRAEAEEIFYGINTFHIGDENIQGFLNSLGSRRLAAITAVTTSCKDGTAALSALKHLSKLSNLRRWTINVTTSVRYMSISSWTLFRSQLVTGVSNLAQLQELIFLIPSMNDWTKAELERKARLDGVEGSMREVIRQRSYNT